MKILVVGVTGMLGSAVFRRFAVDEGHITFGTLRSRKGLGYFPDAWHERLICDIDVLNQDMLAGVLSDIRPEVIINCAGLIKQHPNASDPLVALPINAMFPHRLAALARLVGARLVHISTDCVFSGRKGMYTENDVSDAEDLYGKSKYIGEVRDLSHAVTLRTSIIGHELSSNVSLVDWFLSQTGSVKGFDRAIFSGLPTVELADIIKNVVVSHSDLHGLYHVSAEPISKHDLLKLVAEVYEKDIDIRHDRSVVIDRSLDSTRFRKATAYAVPSWRDLVSRMRDWGR